MPSSFFNPNDPPYVMGWRNQVMRRTNHPFDGHEKDLRDRLESICLKLQDSISHLNEVSSLAELMPEVRTLQSVFSGEVHALPGFTVLQEPVEQQIELEDEDVSMIYQALEKQQQGLDYLTKMIRRDVKGVELLKEKLDKQLA
jgi:hypothetical protein